MSTGARNSSSRDDRAETVRRIFLTAIEQSSSNRERLLADRCRGDDELRREVESLLEAHDREGGFDRLAMSLAPPALEPGEIVGRYRLLEQIGRGGMGEVYRAERTDGQIERRVAIKVLRADLANGSRSAGQALASRFLVERQILASLDHPNIARLLDGGIIEPGTGRPARPYFVMELIEGEPIDEACDAARSTLDQRLRLFAVVCSAVHHAHRNLIVHRDLKPTNILLTTDGKPKLLDFGIAKLLDDVELPLSVTRTTTGLRLLTPEYASPEQVRGEPVSTATDVYQLGVLLYRLAVGRSPLSLDDATEPELARRICEQSPPRLPRALPAGPEGAEIARRRGTSERALWRRLAGDLDTIVAKALSKDPSRRYASAAELGDDVERLLAMHPIRARPDTLRYRAVQLTRRHPLGVAAGTLAVLLLLVFSALALWQARQAASERDRSEQVTAFLTDLLGGLAPGESPGALVLTESLLESARDRVDLDLGAEPLVQARLFGVLGEVFTLRGRFDEGQRLLEKALGLRAEHLGEEHVDTARSRVALAELLNYAGDYERSARLLEQALPVYRAHYGDEGEPVVLVRIALADQLRGNGDSGRAARLLERMLSSTPAIAGCDRATVLKDLGRIRIEQGRFVESRRMLEEALAIRRDLDGPVHPTVANVLDALGDLLEEEGSLELAEQRFVEALDIRRRIFEPDHPDIAAGLENLGALYREKGDHASAEELLREALEIYRSALGPDNLNAARVLAELGRSEAERGACANGIERLRRAAAVYADRRHAPPPWVARALALCRGGQRDPAESAPAGR